MECMYEATKKKISHAACDKQSARLSKYKLSVLKLLHKVLVSLAAL